MSSVDNSQPSGSNSQAAKPKGGKKQGKQQLKGQAQGQGGQHQSQQRTTRSKNAGLTFPVGRIHTALRRGHYADRVSSGAAVYMAAVLEYLGAEVLELAGNAAKQGTGFTFITN